MTLKQIDRKSNSVLIKIVKDLKDTARKNDAPLWKSIAKKLEGPSRNWPIVNVSRIEYHGEKNSKIIVPGKLLGTGTISKKVTVSAFSFSQTAKKKIENAGGKCMTYSDFMKLNPNGKNVVVIG